MLCCLLFGGCKGKDFETGGVDPDTNTESRPDTQADTSTDPTQTQRGRSGQAWTSGGSVTDGDTWGVSMIAPLEISTNTATDGQLRWQAGPIYSISPQERP